MNSIRSLREFQRTFKQAFRTYHAPFRIPSQPKVRAFHIPVLRNTRTLPSTQQRRLQSTTPSEPDQPRPLTDRPDSTPSEASSIATRKAISPAYQLYFTCKKCLERSGHTVSKQAYHFGTCVINCPKCKNQHLISDHLRVFEDKGMTLEDIAKRHGEKLKKGRLGVDGDVEFYDEAADAEVQKTEAWKTRRVHAHGEGKEARKATEEEQELREMDERIKDALRPRDGQT